MTFLIPLPSFRNDKIADFITDSVAEYGQFDNIKPNYLTREDKVFAITGMGALLFENNQEIYYISKYWNYPWHKPYFDLRANFYPHLSQTKLDRLVIPIKIAYSMNELTQ